MNKNLELILVERFPTLFAQYGGSPQETCMAWGCAHGDGWFKILEALCELITAHENSIVENNARKRVWNTNAETPEFQKEVEHLFAPNPIPIRPLIEYTPVTFGQIKEKFGTLCIYWSGGDEFVDGAVDMAEKMSAITCEECGMPGKIRRGGWIHVSCDKCHKKGRTQ